jgi:hypothetical protein
MQYFRCTPMALQRGRLLLAAVLILAGCAPPPPASVSPEYARHKPTSIAVLPVHNQTGQPLVAPASHAYLKILLERAFAGRDEAANDVALAWRRKISRTLQGKSYRVIPVDAVAGGTTTAQIATAEQLAGADSVLYSTITAWDTRQLKSDNTIFVAASFALVDVETKKVLWEAQWPYGRVSVKATQPWHDIRYYIARVVEGTFATLP